MRIAEFGLAVDEWAAIHGLDPAAGAAQHGMAGRDIHSIVVPRRG